MDQQHNDAYGLELRAMTALRRNTEVGYLHELTGIPQQAPAVQPPITPGVVTSENIKLSTNLYGLGLSSAPVYRYDVIFTGRLRHRDLEIELTKTTYDDILHLNRTEKCRRALELAFDTNPDFFGDQKEKLFYDSQRILYSTMMLNLLDGAPRAFTFTEAELFNEPLFQGFAEVTLNINRVSSNFLIFASDLDRYISNDMNEVDHSLQQFLETLTSQFALNNSDTVICYGNNAAYLLNPEESGFAAGDCPDLGEGKKIAVGADKSVHIIEGPMGRESRRAAVAIDIKKNAFHKAGQTLYQKGCETLHLRNRQQLELRDALRLVPHLRGLHVTTHHGSRPQNFKIETIVQESAVSKIFLLENGQETTVFDYFQTQYGINLKYPNAPLILAARRRSPTYYPMELCFVVDSQRVSIRQQTPAQTSEQIRQSAVTPSDRIQQIGKLLRGLVMNSDNFYHKAAGLTITNKPIIANARVLPNPSIMYGNERQMTPDAAKATWKHNESKPTYLFPASINRWGVFCLTPLRYAVLNRAIVEQFVVKFTAECRARGMTVADCARIGFLNGETQEVKVEMQGVLKTAKEAKIDFLLFITSDEITSLHNYMKLLERETCVVTQDLKATTVVDVVTKSKHLTLENIVNKTNMKLGGLNYTVLFHPVGSKPVLPPGRLVIGFSSSHSHTLQDHHTNVSFLPSIVGVAANVKADPVDFVGDCLFTAPNRDEKTLIMSSVITALINLFVAARDQEPEEIVVYRNGASEGQYKDILDLEMMMIKLVASRLCKKQPRITFICVQRKHNVRLMPAKVDPKARAAQQNIKPGTVVDTQVVHPCYTEFFLNSHVALQGTARTPRYTVLHDDSSMTMDELEALTHGLTFGHQIVNLTTSLPSPVYIAACYAERGNNLFHASAGNYRNRSSGTSSGSGGSSPTSSSSSSATTSSSDATSESSGIDFARLVEEFSYGNTSMGLQRVNA